MTENFKSVMTKEEYQASVAACYTCAAMLAQFDLREVLQRIETADVVGPILDPTLWMQNSDKMQEDKTAVKAALELSEFGRRVSEIGSI